MSSPAKILRDALLQYSRDHRRTRDRRHHGHHHILHPLHHGERIQLASDESGPLDSESARAFQRLSEQSSSLSRREQELLPPTPTPTRTTSVVSEEEEFSIHTYEESEVLTQEEESELVSEEKSSVGDVASPFLPHFDSLDSEFGVNCIHRSGVDLIASAIVMEKEQEAKEDEVPQSKADSEDRPGAGLLNEPLYSIGEGSRISDDVVTFNEEYEDVGCCKRKYHVAHDLADGNEYVQSRFIQKVFAMIFIKTFILLAFLSIVEVLEDFKEFYRETYYFHFISAGIYLVIKSTIRITKNFRRRNCCLHLILHIMDIIALGDFLGSAMTHWLTNYVYFVVPRKILYSIGGTSLFFIYVGWFVEYDMRDGIMIGSALIINGLTALHQVLHGTIRGYGFDPNMGKITDEWTCVLIVLGVSELIMLIIMFELKSVLSGNRYSVWYSDWFFTGVYII